jgi:hypothetical protein
MRQPAIMIFFRPIRSESAPKTTNSGIASSNATATMMFAWRLSISSTL